MKPKEEDHIDESDREIEEQQAREEKQEAEKGELDGPANDLIGQPAPADDDDD